MSAQPQITDVMGAIPYRMAFAGGWIDQPFVSRLNPDPPGSMVVVGLEPTFRFMDRAGMSTGTRKVATRLWNGRLPSCRTRQAGEPARLVRELYEEENRGLAEPSGSQDMIGLIYPGVSRLDFDAAHGGGICPSTSSPTTIRRLPARWRTSFPWSPWPRGPKATIRWASRTSIRIGSAAWANRARIAIAQSLPRNLHGLATSMNDCMACWESLLPCVLRHPTLTVDLVAVLRYYQARYPGAMYSGCGGGYLYVVSEEPVPGAFRVTVRTAAG